MEDVNGDNLADLVVHFNTQDFDLSPDDTEATLVGATYDGDQIECSDMVRVVGEGITRNPRQRLVSFSATAAARPLGLTMISPNPSAGELRVSFSLSNATPARLEVVNIRGRRVATEEVGYLGPGTHQFDLSSGKRLAPGTYFIRLTQGSNTAKSKVTVY